MIQQTEFEPLIKYIQKWNSIDGVKPCNEPEFIDWFVKLIKEFPDEREVEFTGEGSYFGKEAVLRPYSYYGKAPRELQFEVAYSKNKISVYSAHHNGFWNPEYLCLDSSDVRFSYVYAEFMCFLKRVFGII